MKRFISILLLTMMVLSFTAFANDGFVNSPNNEPSTDELVDVPGDDPASDDESPKTGIVPVAAIAGVAALGAGTVGVVAFRKKNS